MESGAVDAPVPAEKVDETYKRLRIQTFLAATFGYALYYVCRLSMGVMKQPLIDAGLLSATQLGIIGACMYWAYAVAKFPFQVLQTAVGSAIALLLCWKAGVVKLYNRWYYKAA